MSGSFACVTDGTSSVLKASVWGADGVVCLHCNRLGRHKGGLEHLEQPDWILPGDSISICFQLFGLPMNRPVVPFGVPRFGS